MKHVLPLFFSGFVVACGSRSGLLDADASPPDASTDTTPAAECTQPSDCDGFDDKCAPATCSAEGKCIDLTPVDCDDHDPCTVDSCASTTGGCSHVPATPDNDHDGHRAPLPGHKPGDPGSCGDDCDDTNPLIHPGATETCGVDNDCDGIIPPFHYQLADPTIDAVRVSSDMAPAEPGGLAWNGAHYMASYDGTTGGKFHVYSSQLANDGTITTPESQFTKVTADTAGAVVVWTGSEFGVMWDDRRDDWETYFTRTNEKGDKLGPDMPVSPIDGVWSLGTSMTWTGTEYVVVWEDQIDLDPDFTPYARRLDANGTPLGPAVQLDSDQGAEPQVAVGLSTLAVVWTHTDGRRHDIALRVFDRKLGKVSSVVTLTNDSVSGESPTIAWAGSGYAVAWHDPDHAPHAIYGAVIDESGATVVPTKKITESLKFSRYPALRPLGDRLLLVWSDTKDGNEGYELYSMQIDPKLSPIDRELRITNAAGDSVFAVPASGPTGEVGVLFRDDRTSEDLVYFTRLVCRPEAP